MCTIVWFRRDLRLTDNPALCWAAANGPIVPVYIVDAIDDAIGGASKWWLYQSLAALKHTLPSLRVIHGDALGTIHGLARDTGAKNVVWNRLYTPDTIERDSRLKTELTIAGFTVQSFNASLLHEPWEAKTKQGGPYKVFTPYWRQARHLAVSDVLAVPDIAQTGASSDSVPTFAPKWANGWSDIWTPGEAGAQERLSDFLTESLHGYSTRRDRPAHTATSRLSAHLHFGDISPKQVFQQTLAHVHAHPAHENDAEKFLSELGWREFAHHLLYHQPSMLTENIRPSFDNYPWRDDDSAFDAWTRGQTGYALVDAGMRELWQTGYMHNRVRMVAASFLVKHLQIHWRKGARWFMDTLVDADPANNAAGWQWVAGSGADAAPYFRIFNPSQQAKKFDPEGAYVRCWCPDLFDGSDTYPEPIIEHAFARQRALDGYAKIKSR